MACKYIGHELFNGNSTIGELIYKNCKYIGWIIKKDEMYYKNGN